MIRSDLCHYSRHAYIAVKRMINVAGHNNAIKRNRKLAVKNNTPFRSCISKINNTFIDNAQDFDIVMPIYNLVECSNNYFYDIRKFVELSYRLSK